MALERIGRFEISAELGRGGMSIVYRGVDPVMQRATALKVIRKADLDPAEAPAILDRFKREAQAAGSLHHPNIVAVYEYGEDETFEWIAMELVEGRTLRDHLLAGWRPELARLPSVLEQLLEALDYSHGRGVVHRDVKPGNVLISDMGVAKMSDFGIARVERSHLTQQGEVLGTPSYMAPEQYEGHAIDERTDIYSAGVIVYEVLCGRRPFDGQGGNLMRQILQEPPPPASNFEPRLPVTIDMVLGRALAKRPENRYRGAREFLDALHKAFPGGVPAAVPTTMLPPLSGITGNVGALRRALASSSAPESAKQSDPTVSEKSLPIAVAVAAPARSAVRRPAVLFVDDEERVLNALGHLFRDTYDVETANGGAQALERLRVRPFHVLVSDQRMPEMIGVELLRQAKAVAPGTVRLLLTGYSDLAAIVGSVNESEVFRFISKPWQEEELRATIAEAVDVAIAIEATAAGPAPSLPPNAAVLILGDAALARAAREMANKAYKVLEAASTDAALEILAAEEIAALVCDLDLPATSPTALLRVLKKQSPQTQLIAVSEASDAETIIRLINEARIYRFLRKPVNFSLLQNALLAALGRYARMARSPALLRTESAQAVKQGAAEQSILGRLKSLGGRFAAAFKS
jgi:serine/threonine protein kinase/response regulator RpfG family c-di-GMP phosphodiesterase